MMFSARTVLLNIVYLGWSTLFEGWIIISLNVHFSPCFEDSMVEGRDGVGGVHIVIYTYRHIARLGARSESVLSRKWKYSDWSVSKSGSPCTYVMELKCAFYLSRMVLLVAYFWGECTIFKINYADKHGQLTMHANSGSLKFYGSFII